MQVLTKYGFEDFKTKLNSSSSAATESAEHKQEGFYQRIRKAIEELGPTYIKFGQTLSTREDLLPKALIQQLKSLQDNVPQEPIDLVALLQQELDISAGDYFSEIQSEPIASASIAQTYKARLQNNQQVILKVKRAGIKEIVEADLLLMKDILSILDNYYPGVKEINLLHVLQAFSKSLIEELSFINEQKNINLFQQNFKNNSDTLTMSVYPELSSDNILCISYIQGYKINDKAALKQLQLDPEKIIERCYNLFLSQILDYGFFHADPHPGNILFTADGKISFIDLGAMGSINAQDKALLEDFVVYFIYKDAYRLVQTIKKMAIQIDIKDEKPLIRAVQELLDIISTQALQQIDIKALFSKFSHLLNQNNIIMPEHIYLLVKGLVLMEGIGRDLSPDMNIVEMVKPYISKVAKGHISFERLIDSSMSSLWEMRRMLLSAPETLSKVVDIFNQGELKVQINQRELKQYRKQSKRDSSLNRLLWLSSIFLIAACLLTGVKQASYWGIPVISWVFFALSFIGFSALFIKRKKIEP